jgi:uncharacterized protein YukE
MKRIQKQNAEKIEELHKKLTSATDRYNELVSILNSQIHKVVEGFYEEHASEMKCLSETFNQTSELLESLVEKQNTLMLDYMDKRSDRWHEGEAGVNFTDWQMDWESYATDITIYPDFDVFEGLSISYFESVSLPSFTRPS